MHEFSQFPANYVKLLEERTRIIQYMISDVPRQIQIKNIFSMRLVIIKEKKNGMSHL